MYNTIQDLKVFEKFPLKMKSVHRFNSNNSSNDITFFAIT